MLSWGGVWVLLSGGKFVNHRLNLPYGYVRIHDRLIIWMHQGETQEGGGISPRKVAGPPVRKPRKMDLRRRFT
jgi:hypothetical protein